jgi:hypothetical protein
MEKSSPKTTKEHISLIFDSLVDIIKYPKTTLDNNAYFYHTLYRSEFIVYIYIFKLLINENDYLKDKYEIYKKKYPDKKSIDFNKITNLKPKDELDLLYIVKDKMLNHSYRLSIEKHTITYKDLTYIDSNWLITFISLLLDNSTEECDKEINICYTIPNKDIFKLKKDADIEAFLSEFTFYNIKVKHVDKTRTVKENNILIVKNAAINYLKHLKQFKHGLETEESYLIFYNLLKNECHKQGFILEEETYKLSELDDKYLSKVKEYITPSFYSFSLSKQIHSIENRVWQLSNDLTMLEHMNSALDATMNYINLLYKKTKGATYNKLKWTYNLRDIPILLVLIIQKFTNTYLLSNEEIDYSLLDLTGIKPEYMNSIGDTEEQDIKSNIKGLEVELMSYKATLDNYKEQKKALNLEELGQDRYLKELEIIVGNINRTSIEISRINSTIAGISREYEETKKRISSKYHNAELFNYNNSIIQHICNSITSCSFYLKTNNSIDLLENIIIFEDYKRADNAFYLEISFRNLLKISNTKKITGIEEQTDLPKLAGD